ncbi:hypothetical protein GCM10027043_02120 [Ferruginibacter profundus]
MSQNTQSIQADRVIPLRQITDIRYSYSAGILNLFQELENHSIQPDQAVARLEEAEKRVEDNWLKYRKTYLTRDEQQLVAEVEELKQKADLAINKLKQKISSNPKSLSSGIEDKELYTAVNPLIYKLNDLAQLQVKVSEQLNINNEQLYQSSRRKFYNIIFISLFVACLLSFFIINDTRKLIRELKASNRKIKESEEKFRTFIRYAGDAIFIVNNDLAIADANDSATGLTGFSKEELLTMKISAIMASEEQSRFSDKVEFIKKEGGSLHERNVKRKDGSLVETEVNVRVLEGIGYISIIRDISERKKAILEIRESAEKYQYLFENSPACIIVWDLETLTVLEVNNTVIDKYGYSREEWINMPVLQYRHQEEHARIKEFAQSMLNGSEPVARMSWTHLKKNGDEMKMEIASHKIIYKNRKAILSLGNDVTEQVKAESALRKSEEKYHSLIDHAADSVFMVADNGIIFEVNRSATELLQYTKEELIGKTVLDLHPPEIKDSVPLIWDTLRQNKSYTDERFLQKKDGSKVEVEISRKMLPDASGAIAIVRDITERKVAEEKLRQSEEKHRALIENISDGIVLVDEDWKIIYQSPSVERIAGYSIEDRNGKTAMDFIHPDDVQLCIDQYESSRTSPGISVQSQYRTRHKMGHYIWIEVFLMNLLHDKSVNAYVVVYRDISERRKAEEQQLLISSIVNSSDDAIISKSLDGYLTSWNKGAEKILGYTYDEMVGQHISRIIPTDLLKEEDEILAGIRLGKLIEHFETKRVRKNGDLIDVALTISPIKDIMGNVVGASKILRDITEQKRAAEIIKQSEANYRQLFDLSPASMWVVDYETRKFTQVNKASIKNYGYSAEEFANMTIDNISPVTSDGELEKSGIEKRPASDFINSGQRHVKKSGELMDVEISSIPVVLNGEKKILLIAIDVTEKNEYERKLTRASIKAQEEERYEIGGELHDNVCQILATSLIFLGLMKKSIPPGINEFFEQTHEYITLASNEIRNLSHRLAPAFFDNATLEDAFKHLLKSFNAEKKYKISLYFNEAAKTYTMDRDLQLNLYRILQEQLRNILKHAKALNIEVEVTINDNMLQMKITDDGIGFDSKAGKAGIGLANMNRRVQLFSGSFVIHSAVGNGCEVIVDIPLLKAD